MLRSAVSSLMTDYQIVRLDNQNKKHRSFAENELAECAYIINKEYYPDFRNWYNNKVLDDFLKGSRIIYVVLNGDKIMGVSIAKISQSQYQSNKISTFFLLPEVTGQGIGTQLLQKTLQVIRVESKLNDRVIITVPEEKANRIFQEKTFLDFLERNNFRVIETLIGRYRPNKAEYVLSLQLSPI
jgi:GNAT superfamily N-acetyltransferase